MLLINPKLYNVPKYFKNLKLNLFLNQTNKKNLF